MKFRTTAFERMLERYGQEVTIYFDGAEAQKVSTRAFIQPVLNRNKSWFQRQYTSLGTTRERLYLYMGAADVPLDQLGQGYLESGEKQFDVGAAEPVFVGTELSHWWALLTLREEEDPCP
jgi:hypothetical protein